VLVEPLPVEDPPNERRDDELIQEEGGEDDGEEYRGVDDDPRQRPEKTVPASPSRR
jgi:hypothetical protein